MLATQEGNIAVTGLMRRPVNGGSLNPCQTDRYPSPEHSRWSELAVKTQVGDGKVGAKGATDGDQADPPQARYIQRRLEPVWDEGRKGQIDRRPVAGHDELGAIGLPETDIVGGTQMDRVLLTVTAGNQLDADKFRCVQGAAV